MVVSAVVLSVAGSLVAGVSYVVPVAPGLSSASPSRVVTTIVPTTAASRTATSAKVGPWELRRGAVTTGGGVMPMRGGALGGVARGGAARGRVARGGAARGGAARGGVARGGVVLAGRGAAGGCTGGTGTKRRVGVSGPARSLPPQTRQAWLAGSLWVPQATQVQADITVRPAV
ncbi:hypothetical protein Aoc01nite_81260 [Actinoplanes octamycinicus]|nr:hypothetical protein Aoc01nite_81260 [Actinoplanes octamycinicus]